MPSPPCPPVSSPASIGSVQPGGGLCMRLELAWGRCRRAWLRKVRPGYVRRMRSRRQGDCPGCRHDIVDARDLKYYRNVCGYFFLPEDDPFRWRGRLGLARMGFCEILVVTFLFLAAAAFLFALPLPYWLISTLFALLAVLWGELVWFFRDPERTIPEDPAALVSPADGTVTEVGIVDDADFAGGKAFRISIFLSVFNVHVNRSPWGGSIEKLTYFPGKFWNAMRPESARENEQLWIDLADGSRRIRVKQISGLIARRIVCWLREGDMIQKGERLGMIKFGSRTDVLLSAEDSVELAVKVGDKVRGGTTILLRFRG